MFYFFIIIIFSHIFLLFLPKLIKKMEEFLNKQNKDIIKPMLDPIKDRVVNGTLTYYPGSWVGTVLTSLLYVNRDLFNTVENPITDTENIPPPNYIKFIQKENVGIGYRYTKISRYSGDFMTKLLNKNVILNDCTKLLNGDDEETQISIFEVNNLSNFFNLNKEFYLKKIRVGFTGISDIANASIKILKETFDKGVVSVNDYKLNDFISKDQYQTTFIDVPIDLIITKDKYISLENTFPLSSISFNINFYINLLNNEIN